MVMLDHVHFFCSPQGANANPLEKFVGPWKEWTAKHVGRETGVISGRLWQPNFFDHLLRNENSYDQKSAYVQLNPVRAGIVSKPADWQYAGHINPL